MTFNTTNVLKLIGIVVAGNWVADEMRANSPVWLI